MDLAERGDWISLWSVGVVGFGMWGERAWRACRDWQRFLLRLLEEVRGESKYPLDAEEGRERGDSGGLVMSDGASEADHTGGRRAVQLDL